MNILYTVGGIACIGLGLAITITQIRRIKAGKQDKLGFIYQLLAGGTIAIMGGVALVAKYI